MSSRFTALARSNRDSPRPLPFLWPVYLADENGKKFSRFWLHHVANPPKSVAKKVGWLWSDVREEVWFGSISKLTCDLGLFLVESFSGFKVLYFAVFWDLGRCLFIEGQ